MGENAANVLIDNILNQTDYFPQEHQIKGELIIRKSSKK
jgi:DNA-binding LacI/PurR family transcriptional regulator